MPSFDVVSELDLQGVDNAINVAVKKISQRYDFKGAHILVELNKKEKTLKVEAPEDKVAAVREIVNSALFDQKVSPKVVEWGDKHEAHMGTVRLNCKLVEGIEKDKAKDINKRIKDMGLKVKSSIQGDQVRVEGKSIDDLQTVIANLKTLDMDVPLQFVNMKK